MTLRRSTNTDIDLTVTAMTDASYQLVLRSVQIGCPDESTVPSVFALDLPLTADRSDWPEEWEVQATSAEVIVGELDFSKARTLRLTTGTDPSILVLDREKPISMKGRVLHGYSTKHAQPVVNGEWHLVNYFLSDEESRTIYVYDLVAVPADEKSPDMTR